MDRKVSSAARQTATLRLRVSAAAEGQVRAGHPWVYSDSVQEQNRAGAAGELAVIFDRKDRFLAIGFYDPDSPIRVRVLHTGKPLTIGAEFWRARLDAAVRRRDGLFDERTNGYRLINGESDGWPGLVLDRYDATLVLKIYTTAWRGRLSEIVSLMGERLRPERIVLRMSRNCRGTSVPPVRMETNQREASAAVSDGVRDWRDGQLLFTNHAGSETGAPVVFLESGLRFEADVWRGQKTGFFLDQRENRRLVASLARGRAVLNAFSFSGGFSLYAARGGASSVTDLDISKHALESARRNFVLNHGEAVLAGCRREMIQGDAFAWLAGNAQRKFDLLVLDPPSLAKREAERPGAIRAYGQLVANGLRHLARRGILVACSCSAHVSTEEFIGAVRAAARRSGRQFTEMQTTRHAPDHPAAFKEAEYLKGIYLRVE
jgi:23S rRNA (cytosine1962-C5)-methyltransferase